MQWFQEAGGGASQEMEAVSRFRRWPRRAAWVAVVLGLFAHSVATVEAQGLKEARRPSAKIEDAKNRRTGNPEPERDPAFAQFGIYEKSAPRAAHGPPRKTTLPLQLNQHERIVLIGNTLFERLQLFGHFESLLQSAFPKHELVVRNLAWSADTPDLQPRPENFADQIQHLTHERADVILAAWGFNESFAGEAGLEEFRQSLRQHVMDLKSRAFNGSTGPRVVLVSPTANENIDGVNAADLNQTRLAAYVAAMREVAAEQQVGFVDLFEPTLSAFDDPKTDFTINGVHLNENGYALMAVSLFEQILDRPAGTVSEPLRQAVLDKNRQYFRRYRPLNTFYYTGGRNESYGYLDFLPAMRSFDVMVANRDQRIWRLARGKKVSDVPDDSNVPPLPETAESRGANRWISAADELREFDVDPRFEVNLFAGEEEFPDLAAPIQMRWDSRGRLWVSCSTTYPHVYPGSEPHDKLVILEDTDGDGRADRSSVFADDLHIPLSFEFGDGGVYVSEMPYLTFLKDTDGDGKADYRRRLLSGFGTEDSHHSLHDFVWTPDGDLLFRESIFHHSQVETPYGPVRQQNSGWFRFEPERHRLTSFGTYHSTNPWGVTFDDWGQHVASHPIYAAAFHSLDPPYPTQHPKPAGLRAYSGTCGQEFVDFATFPEELQGGYIKVRYKPTNQVEIHRWVENQFGFDEEFVGNLIFSRNLSFIPVDIRFGPRGALYVCDWYNPIKGHAQYSLRDERRDRHSGRIWRITTKGRPLQDAPRIAEASIAELLEILKRPEGRYRYWARRELREREPGQVEPELERWVASLSAGDPRYRHHQLEALWVYRGIDRVNTELLKELLGCEEHLARAAATEQLRYWAGHLPNSTELLRASANDANGIVRMQSAIAASWIGTRDALDAMLDVVNHPSDQHVAYAIRCALGSASLRKHWEENSNYNIRQLMQRLERSSELKEPKPTPEQAAFDRRPDLKSVRISCVPERMRYTVEQFTVRTGQPVKIVFTNPDATDHNLVIVRPGALAEVGMAANDMARDPSNARSDFIPESKQDLILQWVPMIGPTRKSQVHVLRFEAPSEPGLYPFVCTFPGHWVIMKGEIAVADTDEAAAALLASRSPTTVKEWKLEDFVDISVTHDEPSVMRGMQAFMKARCHQCHVVGGHGTRLGPDLTDVAKRYRGEKLLRQLLQPSTEINPKYQTHQFLLNSGKIVSGVIVEETPSEFRVVSNLLTPQVITPVVRSEIDEQFPSKISPMPEGLVNMLTRDEILDLLSFLEAGGYQLPEHLRHGRHGMPPKPDDQSPQSGSEPPQHPHGESTQTADTPVKAIQRPIPDKLVVLTFDDSVRSHYTVVRPILKKYGFGATFFITEGWDFATNKQDYMTWEQIAQLHRDGFEIGNHTRDHLGITNRTVERLPEQLEAIAAKCEAHGIPRPVSFAWPGNATTPQAFELLRSHGIRFARRGGAPEYPYEEGRGVAYEPGADHPLLLPSAADARPKWTLGDFIRGVEQARGQRVAILQFHGVPDTAHDWVSTAEQNFEAYMKYLHLQKCRVIALRDLERYVDHRIWPADHEAVVERRLKSIRQQAGSQSPDTDAKSR